MILDTKNYKIGPYFAKIAKIVWKMCRECVKVWEKMFETVKNWMPLHRRFYIYIQLQKLTNIASVVKILLFFQNHFSYA